MSGNTKQSSTSKKTVQPVTKVGIEQPIRAAFAEDPRLGPYGLITIHVNAVPLPVGEFVLSKHIGATNDPVLKQSYVLNQRKDIPSLIRDSSDPFKSRHEKARMDLQLKALVEEGLLEKVGETFIITKQVSAVMAGIEYGRHFDRAKKAYEEAKATALAVHEQAQEGKAFRFRKKFRFQRILDDFLSKEEKDARTMFGTVLGKPKLIQEIEEKTRSNHETLVGGDRPQKKLVVPGQDDVSDLKISEVMGIVRNAIQSVFSQKVAKPTAAEMTAVEALEKEKAILAKQLREEQLKTQSLENYFDSGKSIENQLREKLNEAEIHISELEERIENLLNGEEEEEEEEEAPTSKPVAHSGKTEGI